MILISIDPFGTRRILLVLAALLCFSAACFADPVLMAQRYEAGSLRRSSGAFWDADATAKSKAVDLRSRGEQWLRRAEQPSALSTGLGRLFFDVSMTRLS
jgi:hypothetical protein